MSSKSIDCNSLISSALGKKCFSRDPSDTLLAHGVEKTSILGGKEFSSTKGDVGQILDRLLIRPI